MCKNQKYVSLVVQFSVCNFPFQLMVRLTTEQFANLIVYLRLNFSKTLFATLIWCRAVI